MSAIKFSIHTFIHSFHVTIMGNCNMLFFSSNYPLKLFIDHDMSFINFLFFIFFNNSKDRKGGISHSSSTMLIYSRKYEEIVFRIKY